MTGPTLASVSALRHLSHSLTSFFRASAGVSAIEFALVAPFLFFGVAAMIDLGFAAHQRMTMDHLLRSGAQAAMNDPGADHVRDVIVASAGTDLEPGADFTLIVERYCACAAASDVAVACSTICAGNERTGLYYRLSGTRTYPGLILPAMDLRAEAKVQVR